jgi:phenylacetic acid degradation protein
MEIYFFNTHLFLPMFYQFQQFKPVVDPTSFVHPQAAITGNVIIGPHCYIGPGAALRGDWGGIILEAGCNVQENCTIHMFPGITVKLEAGAHIGHGAIIHGAQIGANCLIGMNAVVMDHVVIGKESIVGALSFVQSGTQFEARSLIVGNPARVIRSVSDEMMQWKTEGTALYQQLPADMRASWAPCEPLSAPEPDRPTQEMNYRTWPSTQKEKD